MTSILAGVLLIAYRVLWEVVYRRMHSGWHNLRWVNHAFIGLAGLALIARPFSTFASGCLIIGALAVAVASLFSVRHGRARP